MTINQLFLLEQAGKLIIEALGCDPNDRNFARTPQRFAAMWEEVFHPNEELDIPVFPEDCTDLVVIRGFRAWTYCPHHLVPVKLCVSVGYVPNGDVIGASKLIRVFHEVNRRPMTQELLTRSVVDKLNYLVPSNKGAGCVITGEHGCMQMRGVRQESDMITTNFSGALKIDHDFQDRFLDMVRSAHER